jgi:GPH family glycoside/pentoside/hexuronide:cation symporter
VTGVGVKTRLLYGSGGAVYAVKESAYTMFILLFYTQVLGLSGWVTGLIIGISLIWDGISDPLVGALSDRMTSRWGRRHPFMLISTLPMGLGFIGLFSPPPAIAASDTQLALWLLFWSVWVRTFITGFSIPHLALSAEISSDYTGRSQVLGTRMAFMFLCGVLLPAAALTFIFPEQNGVDERFNASRYPLYGALSCAITWLMASITMLGTRQFIKPSTSTLKQHNPSQGLAGLTLDLVRTLKNRTFRLLIGYELMASISYGTVATLNMLAWTYFWEFSARQVSIILAVPSVIAIVLVMVTLGPLSRRFQKYQLLRMANIVIILDMLWLYPLRIMDLLPENGSNTIFWLNFVFMLVFIYCFLLRTIAASSIVADIADEHELEHGVRQEAGFFSVINFLYKLASTVGPLYSGVVLDIIGLHEGLMPGEVPETVLNNLALAMGLGAIPALFIGLWFVFQVNMNREKVEQIQTTLDERRHTQD